MEDSSSPLCSERQGKMALVLLTFCCEFMRKIKKYFPTRFLRISYHKSKKILYKTLIILSLFFRKRKWEHI